MLEDFLALIGAFILGFAFFVGGLNFYIGITKWYQLQAETQFVADAVAQDGGYTETTNSNLRDFTSQENFDPSEVQVTPNPLNVTGPSNAAVYGQEVAVTMEYPFRFQVWTNSKGGVVLFDLKTYASAISTFVPNEQVGYQQEQIVYTQPSL